MWNAAKELIGFAVLASVGLMMLAYIASFLV